MIGDLVDITSLGEANSWKQWDWIPVHCDISSLFLSSTLEARNVPVLGFLQIANTNWNYSLERWFLDFTWRQVRWGVCGNEEFEKALAEIQFDTYHIGLKCSSKAISGGTTQASARAGRLPCRPGPRAHLEKRLNDWNRLARTQESKQQDGNFEHGSTTSAANIRKQTV